MLEILAPSGNEECAEVAIANGANAIYLGYTAFSARDGADNFDDEALFRGETIITSEVKVQRTIVSKNTSKTPRQACA